VVWELDLSALLVSCFSVSFACIFYHLLQASIICCCQGHLLLGQAFKAYSTTAAEWDLLVSQAF